VNESAQNASQGASCTHVAVSQLSQAIEGIAAGAAEQARQVQAASSTASSMAEGVEHVAASAQRVAAGGQRMRDTAESGAEAVRATVAGMAAIQRVVDQPPDESRSWERWANASGPSSRPST
jgi:methyl-accepting chemotaxis protein